MKKLAFLDIETNGFEATSENIIEIAIIGFDGGMLEYEFHSLLKPKTMISRKTTRITGINQSMVAKAPGFWTVAKKIILLTQDRILVGHNISFDCGFLRSSFREVGFDFKRECLCTLRTARQCLPQLKQHDLQNLAKHMDLPNKPSHRAIDDAKAVMDLFFELRKKASAPTTSLKTLSPALMKDPTPFIPALPGVYFLYDKDGSHK
ncbi:MAG: 3'-5' exonuclease [Oligoflexales bacterium]|nr:3'-5' exonuclease [Oligoflexales bacterium]